MSNPAWHILTGEYPPAPGGVSDYTFSIAHALAAAGDEVHVWAPPRGGAAQHPPGVVVHHLEGGFGPRGLRRLSAGLAACGGRRRLLVQYVPTAFGWKSMNVPFAGWLAGRRGDEVWVMFHEVAYPWGKGHALKINLLGAVTRAMAALLARRADRSFTSIPGWNRLLAKLAPAKPPAEWLPIPSNLPASVPAGAASAARERILTAVGRAPSPGVKLVGHFGTYGSPHAEGLSAFVTAFSGARPDTVVVFLGRGGKDFAARHGFTGVHAPGALPGEEVAAHLSACDVVVQPFVDGISSRRTSAMASLALGRPVVSNRGILTEPDLWSSAVCLADAYTPAALVAGVSSLLDDPRRAADVASAGLRLYRESFALERIIGRLRGEPAVHECAQPSALPNPSQSG